MASIFATKRGVSPLVATILLIAFAVALGSVIMNWGLNLNVGKLGSECNGVIIKIRNIENHDVCYGGIGQDGYIKFIIDNVGSVDISGMTILIEGEKGTKLVELQHGIAKGTLYDTKDKEIAYDFSTYGSIKQVQFIPKASSDKGSGSCAKSAVEAEKIGVCS